LRLPRIHPVVTLWLGPLKVGERPRPGWTFLSGGSGPGGPYLTEEDDRGHTWFTRYLLTASGGGQEGDFAGVMLGLRSSIPDEAAVTMGNVVRRHGRN
jgi:hypothetical protein